MPLDAKRGFDATQVHACPHCFNNDDSMCEIGKMYDVVDIISTTDYVEQSLDIENLTESKGQLSETEWSDWKAVKCEDRSYAERGRKRGVSRQAVHQAVVKAEEKLSGGK